VWSQFQATLGETSQGTWAGWEGVPGEVWDSTGTTVSSQRDHVETKGDRAKVETVGEGSDLYEGTGGEAAGGSGGSTKKKDGEGESVRK